MLGCYLSASGEEFDVGSFLSTTTLKPDAVFYRGQPLAPLDGQVKETGFSVMICETRLFGDLDQQISHALQFLRKEQRELVRLAQSPGVTDLRLTFPYCHEERMGYEYFPPELLALAGSCGIGLALSVYPGPPSGHEASDQNAEPCPAPNDGLATPLGNPGVTEEPPSVN
ncbi:MAG: hypothetical protein HZA90_14600 [Verrucomicrobia bacterium]|nr:hypothetical protein [Verrucomicrobiota bacterium]